MAAVDLGQVAMLPWTNLLPLFEYPPSTNYTVEGGYKVYGGKCYVMINITAKAAVTLQFPAPKESITTWINTDGVASQITFNGSIALKANSNLQWQETYTVGA